MPKCTSHSRRVGTIATASAQIHCWCVSRGHVILLISFSPSETIPGLKRNMRNLTTASYWRALASRKRCFMFALSASKSWVVRASQNHLENAGRGGNLHSALPLRRAKASKVGDCPTIKILLSDLHQGSAKLWRFGDQKISFPCLFE